VDSLLAYLCRFVVRAPQASIAAFLGSCFGGFAFRLPFSDPCQYADLPTYPSVPDWTCPTNRTLHLSRCVPASLCGPRWYRILYRFPIAYALSLGLGPDLPWVDYPSPGNLRLPAVRFLTLLSLLMPAFSLLYSPASLPLGLLPVQYAPLPQTEVRCRKSDVGYSPLLYHRVYLLP